MELPAGRVRPTAIVVAFACVLPVRAQLNRIAEVRIEGNKVIPTEIIREVLAIQVGDEYSEEDDAADAQAIREMGRLSKVDYDIKRKRNGVVIVFRVEENDVVEKVVLAGNNSISTERLMEAVKLEPGEVLYSKTVEDDVAAIEELYRSEGYLAKVIDVDLKDGVFTYLIQEVVIHDVQIEGLKRT